MMHCRIRVWRRGLRIATASVALALVCCAIAAACRYTVRDIGFVDLRGPEYVVVVRGDNAASITPGLQQRFKDSNVRCVVESDIVASNNVASEVVESDVDESAASESALTRTAGQLVILDSQGRALSLADSDEPLDLDSASQIIDEALFTPMIDSLAEASCSSFAQMVLICGPEVEANRAATEIMQEAEQALRRIEPLLPRPLQYPVGTLKVDFESRPAERAAIWSLGIDPDAIKEPILAVVYGRGRLAGPAMVGDKIDLRETLAQLALVGESCECETDRAWLQERVLPIEWPASLREAAAETLGFDPESPLVQAEVTRIVSRGPSNGDRGSARARQGSDDIERLLLGYEETQLQPLDDTVGGGAETYSDHSNQSPGDLGSGVKATIQSGAGWGFDEESEPEPTVQSNAATTHDGVATNDDAEGLAGSPLNPHRLESVSSNDEETEEEAAEEAKQRADSSDDRPGDRDDTDAGTGGAVMSLTLTLVALGAVALFVVGWIVLGGRGR